MLRLITLTAAATLVAGAAFSETVVIPFETDIGISPGTFGEPEVELGFTYLNTGSYRDFADDYLYLHDDTGGITSSTFTRVDGRRFDAYGADVSGYSHIYLSAVGAHPDGDTGLEYDLGGDLMHIEYVPEIYGRVEGFRDGAIVAGETFMLPSPGPYVSNPFEPISFNSAFHDLDSLTLSIVLPAGATAGFFDTFDITALTPAAGEFYCIDTWCGGLKVDNLRLSPVPLPGGLALLGTALPLLALGRRRRRA